MIDVRTTGPEALVDYARISIAFEVRTVLRVESASGAAWGFRLVEEPVQTPYLKDYDASGGPDGHVLGWAKHFDVSRWGFFMAWQDGEAVGAATVAVHTPGVHMLEGRDDLAVLWDIRVRPDRRGHGIGTMVFEHAAEWARKLGCRQLKIETQNTNVPACRFYATRGCVLGAINRFGYAGCPAVAHETMLLWYLDLQTAPPD